MYQKEQPLLSLKDISLSFGEKKILRDINVKIDDITSTNQILGQVTTIVGRSGVGKSQLFKIIAGLSKPTTGQVLVGREQKPVKAGDVGMVLQNYPLFAHYTLRGNLELVCKEKDKIDDYLNQFEIWDCQNNYPNKLSGGQKQRTAIVQQLLCSSTLILLDEPFSGLDPVATEKLCLNINKVANQNSDNTVLISSHILEPSLAISDSIWVIGHEYQDGQKIPGATIRYNEDLAKQGLAWNPDIRRDPRFTDLVERIRMTFHQI